MYIELQGQTDPVPALRVPALKERAEEGCGLEMPGSRGAQRCGGRAGTLRLGKALDSALMFC